MVKHLPAVQETWLWSLGWEDSLEKEMATHSSVLAWRIPWTEEPGGLQSMEPQRVDTTKWLTHTQAVLSLFCVGVRVCWFTRGCPTFWTPLAEETVVVSTVYSCLHCWGLVDRRCVGLSLGSLSCPIDLRVCFCASTTLFVYCNFIVLSKVWEGYISCFVLFPQDFFGSSGSFRVPHVLCFWWHI